MQNNELLTTEQLAEILGIKPNTIEIWRLKGQGPRFCKLGRSVRYRREDVEEWINENIYQNTCQSGKRG